MRSIIIILFSILATMETFSQNRTTDRQPVAAGSFYPADKESLTKDIKQRFENCIKSPGNWNVRAIISPHAGYVFSGKVAASAFSSIPGNSVYKNIFIIGSSHVMAFDGASVYSSGDYITLLGRVEVNKKIANTLKQEHKVFNFPEDAHIKEHSIEVQLPFIQYYFKNNPLIIPIIIGTEDEDKIKQIAEALRPWFKPENLFIISSDFSHYPPYKDAVEVDNATAMGIVSGNPLTFLEVLRKNSARKVSGLATSMCGWTSGLTLLYLTTVNSMLEYKLVDYRNSGDSPYGGKNEVVGYNAITVVEKIQNIKSTQEAGNEFSFNDEEKLMLFKIAKNSILSRLTGKKVSLPDEKDMPAKFKTPMGAFVTIKINGALRGCIGRFISSDPLYKVVDASAYSSAFEDPRFLPLTMEEFKKTNFEITVLGPLKKINNINEIVLGKHGIYIKKGLNSGTMLPQVATENGWTVEEFLGYTSREKVGIGYDGWKDAEIYIYEGVVLEDNNK
jgi:AmmeMemoRadiSam system protein B/AmmeMemoRadiSam system protein A